MAQRYGKWNIVCPLGRGGQAHTYLVKAEGAEPAREFVLKRLGTDRLERARAELRAIKELSHPNIVQLIDDDLESTKPYIVMEYCSGGALSDVGILEYPLLLRLSMFSEICRGVGHAHSHTPIITHRDLKPANIFLREDKVTPVVGDFGLCFFDEGERITLIGDAAVGARMYIAPELAHGFAEDVTPRADVYSLGKVLYWMLSGKVFDREMQRHQRFDLTRNQTAPDYFFIYDLLDKMITEEPADRFADASEVVNAVEEVISLIKIKAHLLDLKVPQHCNYCGRGIYKPVADSTSLNDRSGSTDVYNFGFTLVGQPLWLILVCDYCGNVQMFRPDYAQKRDAWRK